MSRSVLNTGKNVDFTKQPMFFGEDLQIQRYDDMKYPIFDKLNQQQLGYFWRPEEISLQKDRNDYAQLSEQQKFIFTANLKYQTMLDSVQGRGPCLAFLPFVSLPEIEGCIVTWDFIETIHSRSYTYIIKNLYSQPGEVFDTIIQDEKIEKRAESVTKTYDDLIKMGYQCTIDKSKVDMYELKKKLYLAMVSVNILEGLRFYVSFACSWAFAELKKMEGNAKIIKLIARDENLHLASTQMMLKLLRKEDPDFEQIAKETEEECIQMFVDAVDQVERHGRTALRGHGTGQCGQRTLQPHAYCH